MSTLILQGTMLPFNLDLTLSCGQTFRWEKTGKYWLGVIGENMVSLCQESDIIRYSGITADQIIRYFALDLDLQSLLREIISTITRFRGSEDTLFSQVFHSSQGLRILRQDPWECIASFICSTNSNIPTIKKRVRLLSMQFGKHIKDDGYAFPLPGTLACGSDEQLRECKTGYRAGFLNRTAEMLTQNPDLLLRIYRMEYAEARSVLMSLPGIGPKVADCVLLFGYQKYEAFPVDIWMKRIIHTYYLEMIGNSEPSYDTISRFSRKYFGEYAGYAQEYLFAAREAVMSESHQTGEES